MKLGELKLSVLNLLEESDENEIDLTQDEDIAKKMNDAINKILFELARMKKIPARLTVTAEKDEEFNLNNIDDLYQLKAIKGVAFDRVENYVTWSEDGTAQVYYYRYPTLINSDIDDDFDLELSLDALNIAPMGIAGTILLSDVSNQYGRVYLNEYEKMLQRLDSRLSDTLITFAGNPDE